MTEYDPYDRLIDACRNFTQYPYNLLDETVPRAILDGYRDYLLQHDSDLFDSYRQRLVLWEAWPGALSFTQANFEDLKRLTEHLVRDGVDPNCRHIFIESDHSRAALNCSSEALKTLFTYHQVDPSFLDSIFAFGDQEEPLDAGLAHFRSDDKLSSPDRLPRIPRVGRSGAELRHSFLLRSIERSEGSIDPWSIRQMAAYHSFDVETGRSIWITVKGNDLLQRRIMDDTVDLPVHQGAMLPDVTAAFEASLATHLIYFRWCEENWRWYIRDVEDRIRDSLMRAKTATVDSGPRFTSAPPKTETGLSASSKGSDFKRISEKLGLVQTIKGFRRPRPKILDLAPPMRAETQEPHLPGTPGPRGLPDGILVLNHFGYKDLQKLGNLSERLEEASLVIQLNLDVLRSVHDYYRRPIECEGLTDKVRVQMEKSAAAFLLRLQQIIGNLETRHTQLGSLRRRLDIGKVLFENLQQLRSLQISRVFADNGHRSSINMENIARRTERETVSMHTVTVVTLLFLPATFLGTFFQSGVFQWAERPEIAGDWFFRTDVFELFMAICVPMTVLTMLGWVVVNIVAKVQARRKISEGGIMAEVDVTRSPRSLV